MVSKNKVKILRQSNCSNEISHIIYLAMVQKGYMIQVGGPSQLDNELIKRQYHIVTMNTLMKKFALALIRCKLYYNKNINIDTILNH
jgi:hypothetical protein